MNINLSGAASQSKKQGKKSGKNIGFGLNKRKKNVFDDDSDDDGDDDGNSNDNNKDTERSRRDAVNREIAAEQAALRKRALKAMDGAKDSTVYDYDGAYDSFKPQEEERPSKKDDEPKKSRYVGDMLEQSKRRAIERDIVYERKVAREQEEESAQADFQGKEKFVTKAYKRKLEERRRLAEENARQLEQDEQDDVTKKRGGEAMAGFYGNLNRNVALGGTMSESKEQGEEPKDEANNATRTAEPASTTRRVAEKETSNATSATRGHIKRGVGDDSNSARVAEDKDGRSHRFQKPATETSSTKQQQTKELSPAEKNRQMRKAREEKLAKARIRYFQRNGMPLEGIAST